MSINSTIKDTFSILVDPHELTNIRLCIIQKLKAQTGTYIHEKRYYLDKIVKLLSIAQFGVISRTNHLISFNVTAIVSFVRPSVGDIVSGSISTIIKHGIFVQTRLYTSIVPTPLQHEKIHHVGEIVNVRIEDVKFSAKHIYTISSIFEEVQNQVWLWNISVFD
jgi:DNA-directed RNA polymerase subunit E'/Rpb7